MRCYYKTSQTILDWLYGRPHPPRMRSAPSPTGEGYLIVSFINKISQSKIICAEKRSFCLPQRGKGDRDSGGWGVTIKHRKQYLIDCMGDLIRLACAQHLSLRLGQRSGSDTILWCHSLPSRRFTAPTGEVCVFVSPSIKFCATLFFCKTPLLLLEKGWD